MPYPVGPTITSVGTNTTTHSPAKLPAHQTDDVLVWAVNCNSSAGTMGAVTNWTQEATYAGDGQNLAIYSIKATSSSTAIPTVTKTSTAPVGWSSLVTCIRGVNTSDTVDVISSRQAISDSANATTGQTVTTTTDNSLVVNYIFRGYNSYGIPMHTDDRGTSLGFVGAGQNCAVSAAYDLKRTAGTTTGFSQYLEVILLGLAASGYTLAFKPATTTQGIPTYADVTVTDVSMIKINNWYERTSNYKDGWQATDLTTINGVSITSIGPGWGVNLGYKSGQNSVVFQHQSNVNYTGQEVARWTGTWNFSTRPFFVAGMYNQNPSDALGEVKSLVVGFKDAGNDDISYEVANSGSLPNFIGPTVLSINTAQTTTSLQARGSLDLTAIDSIPVHTLCPLATDNNRQHWGEMYQLSKLGIAGGDSTAPVGIEGVARVGQLNRIEMIGQNGTVLTAVVPVQIGGSDPVYLDLNGCSWVYPRAYSTTNNTQLYHWTGSDIGLTLYATASTDAIKFRNSTFTTPSGAYFTIHASSHVDATYDFKNLTINGAAVTLKAVNTAYQQMTFLGCEAIQADGCNIQSCTFFGNVNSDCLELGTTGTITTSTIDTTTLAATEFFMDSTCADADNITNCTFNGSSTSGHAIKLTGTAANFTLTGNTFNNYGATGTDSAAIFNDTGGAVQISIGGGVALPTYKNGSGATTTIVSSVPVKVTVKDVDTLANIQDARVLLTAAAGGDMFVDETVTLTRASTTVTVAHTAHGLKMHPTATEYIVIEGATQPEYNGLWAVTAVPNTNSYEFQIGSTPTTPATGTITSTEVALTGTSNASGVVENTGFNYSASQPVTGWVRKSTGAPYYKQSVLTGTITSTGLDLTSLMIKDQ